MTFNSSINISALKLLPSGKLSKRITELKSLQTPCRLCPHHCLVNRKENYLGICEAPAQLKISSGFAHFGEEPELVGTCGSGTIFLSHCNLRCVFCQNCEISHLNEGRRISLKEMALLMLRLQEQGCHNINFVTPSHYVPQIMEAVELALNEGLNVPLVYNCSGYESLEVLKLLHGIIDIYMPDFKFATKKSSERYANVSDYFNVASYALNEMHRQVGDLKINKSGIAYRGLLIRHLVMPTLYDDSKIILEFIAKNLSTNSYVNIMGQYHPSHLAFDFPELRHRISYLELNEIKDYARSLGLKRGF